MANGKFVISLDFELMWGVLDRDSLDAYLDNLKGVQQVIPQLLKTFDEFKVTATFSTVGLLFLTNPEDFNSNIPSQKPSYSNKRLSPYHLKENGLDQHLNDADLCFAPQLIQAIQRYPEQEIGTHTFSHYYCLEPDQTLEEFRHDLQQAIQLASKQNIELTSLVFPRNQFNDDYLAVCRELGIICVRGNESSWLYEARNKSDEKLFRRALRLLDAYINLSGHNCYLDQDMIKDGMIDIPSSRFLRPYSSKLSVLDSLRLARIKSGMTHAAKRNKTYHLWWHPHNFGVNQTENFRILKKILKHYRMLNDRYNFASYTMSGLAKKLLE